MTDYCKCNNKEIEKNINGSNKLSFDFKSEGRSLLIVYEEGVDAQLLQPRGSGMKNFYENIERIIRENNIVRIPCQVCRKDLLSVEDILSIGQIINFSIDINNDIMNFIKQLHPNIAQQKLNRSTTVTATTGGMVYHYIPNGAAGNCGTVTVYSAT